MGSSKRPTEGGSGGKRGHSNMTHWEKTEIIKEEAKKQRRQNDKSTTKEELDNLRSKK